MKEGKLKRKDLIKNVAIIFLSVLLVLTFFSNTIMNYALPEVATAFVQPGNIATRVRGSAVIEATDPYSVVAKESRTITSVAVKVNDVVERGDVIYHLEEKDSLELRQALDTLKELELSFMQQLLSGDIRPNVINRVDAGNFDTYEELRNRLTGILSGVQASENEIESLTRNVEAKQRRLVSLGVPSGTQVALKDDLLLGVENAAKYIMGVINGILTHYQGFSFLNEEGALEEARMKTTLTSLYNTDQISKSNFEASSEAYDTVMKSYTDAENKLKYAITAAENEYILAVQALNEAEIRLGQVSDSQTDIIGDIQAEIKFNNQVAMIDAKKEEIERIREKSEGAAIVAPVDGLIVSLNHVAGEDITIDATVAVIQVAGRGFTASFTVTNEQASRVSVGDPAEVIGGWWWNDIGVVLTGIRPDPNNPGQRRELIFNITGEDIQAGQHVNLSVGQRSANYDMTVPNSAIREDSNSKFILYIETRRTPFDNRYYAMRMDVEVIAEDENNTAILAPIDSYSYVITMATKPVTPGQQIRLTN